MFFAWQLVRELLNTSDIFTALRQDKSLQKANVIMSILRLSDLVPVLAAVLSY